MTDPVDALIRTLLYEGYVLWPYRRSALKNRERWTFGGVHPRGFSRASGGTDRHAVQTELLIRGSAPRVDLEIRYLHVVDRLVAEVDATGRRVFVDEAEVDGARVTSWDEARERRWTRRGIEVAAAGQWTVPLRIPAGETIELADDESPAGDKLGAATERQSREAARGAGIVRRWEALSATVSIETRPLDDGLASLTVRVENASPWPGLDRPSALRRTLVAATVVATVRDGDFISQLDPPPELANAAAGCRNTGLFPVLVGEPGTSDRMLASPIILYDHPRIAPESPGDLFDATEIDQMLVLNVLALTDAEKDEARADPRVRELVDRVEALDEAQLRGINGTFRDIRILGDGTTAAAHDTDLTTDAPGPQHATAVGGEVVPGARVRIRPRSSGGDIFDAVLVDRVAIVDSIEHDLDGGVHVAVTVEDDPGRDLGSMKYPGHRFFYRPDELERLPGPAGRDAPGGAR